MHGAEHTIEVDVPPRVLWDVIADYERYPEFVSFQKDVRVLERRPGETIARFTLDLIATVHFTVRFVEEPPFVLSWTLVESDVMKVNTGAWRLTELARGRTRAHYRVQLGLGRFVPAVLADRLAGHALPATMECFGRRAESLRRE